MTDKELKKILREKYFTDSDYINIFEMILLDADSEMPFDMSGLEDFRDFVVDNFVGDMPTACKWFIGGLVKDE